MSKRGNIKIGTVVNGMPSMLSKIHVTKSYKINNQFVMDNDFNNDSTSLRFRLPFANKDNFDNNLRIMNSAFIKIKNFKYILTQEGDRVIASPLDLKAGTLEKLPTVDLGLYTDWCDKLTFNRKAILECNLINDKTEDGDTETVSGDGFLFKTSSVNSIVEMSEVLDTINDLPSEVVRFLTLKLELYTKLYNKGNIENLTYVRIETPTVKDILLAKKMADTFGSDNNAMLALFEDGVAKRRKDVTITVAEFEKMYGQFTIEADNDDDGEFMNSRGSEDNNKEDKSSKVVEFIEKNDLSKISKNVINSLMAKYSEEEVSLIIEDMRNQNEEITNVSLLKHI